MKIYTYIYINTHVSLIRQLTRGSFLRLIALAAALADVVRKNAAARSMAPHTR